jgi:hypothetical protein
MCNTPEEFRIRFPEFSDDQEYSDARITLFLDDAICFIGNSAARWCSQCLFDKAKCYLAAHLLWKATLTEAGDTTSSLGSITTKTAGGVSVTRSAGTTDRSLSDDFYASTPYGIQYMNIRNRCFVGVLTARFC